MDKRQLKLMQQGKELKEYRERILPAVRANGYEAAISAVVDILKEQGFMVDYEIITTAKVKKLTKFTLFKTDK